VNETTQKKEQTKITATYLKENDLLGWRGLRYIDIINQTTYLWKTHPYSAKKISNYENQEWAVS
jgi:hypothetical protein